MPPVKPEFLPPSCLEALIRKSISLSQRLDRLEEHCIYIVLAKSVEKLTVIQYLLPEPEDDAGLEGYQSITTRMTKLQKIKPPEMKDDDSTEYLKYIQKCLCRAQAALEKMIQGFWSGEGMLYGLKHMLFCENRRYYDNFFLKQENVYLTSTISSLNEKINEVKRHSEETMLYMNKMTQICLQQAATTVWAQCKTLDKNNDVYHQAKVYQNTYRIKDKEDSMLNLREQCESDMMKENIVNDEVTSHLQMVIATIQQNLEKWTATYTEEIDTLDITLLQLRSKMEEQEDKLKTMNQQVAARQSVMETLQAEADEKDREQAKRLAQAKAVIIIQHWWSEVCATRRALLQKQAPTATSSKNKKNKKESPKKKKK